MLAALLWAAAALPAQSPGYPAYERANRLFIAGKYQESFNAIDEALRADPTLVPALTLKAKLALGANRFDVARQSLEKAIASDPRSAYAHFLLGFLYHLQSEMPLALTELGKARELDPKDARPALYLGLTHESLGHTERAAAFYQEAIRLERASDKLQADTLLTYARLLLLLDRIDECEELIDEALKLNPDSRDARYEHARLLLNKGDTRGATAEGERALRLTSPGVADRQIHYLLVRAYSRSGEAEQAARHAEALRALDPDKP
jgi:tetratricopeptide (TPR) repeat protein